jgi:hypothetical protein
MRRRSWFHADSLVMTRRRRGELSGSRRSTALRPRQCGRFAPPGTRRAVGPPPARVHGRLGGERVIPRLPAKCRSAPGKTLDDLARDLEREAGGLSRQTDRAGHGIDAGGLSLCLPARLPSRRRGPPASGPGPRLRGRGLGLRLGAGGAAGGLPAAALVAPPARSGAGEVAENAWVVGHRPQKIPLVADSRAPARKTGGRSSSPSINVGDRRLARVPALEVGLTCRKPATFTRIFVFPRTTSGDLRV